MLRNQLNRLLTLLWIALFALPAFAGGGAINVTRVSGSVKVVAGGKTIAVSAGSSITPPAKIETGANGFVRIEQASSNLDIGPNSVVLVPGGDAEAENIVQNTGRVLYSVKPRKSRSFSVQTPYLVSVVKGTVFSVAIENDATTVSLMEGSVELVADDIAPVLLLPNDTARRGEHDRSINVTKVDVSTPVAGPQAAAPSASSTMTDSATASSAVARDAAIAADLNEITAARSEPRPNPVTPQPPTPGSPPVPPAPSPEPPSPQLPPSTPTPETPTTPAPTPETPSTPAPNVPGSQPEVPAPGDHDHDHDDHHDRDDHDDDDECGRKKCDSGNDHDRGGGNDRK